MFAEGQMLCREHLLYVRHYRGKYRVGNVERNRDALVNNSLVFRIASPSLKKKPTPHPAQETTTKPKQTKKQTEPNKEAKQNKQAKKRGKLPKEM